MNRDKLIELYLKEREYQNGLFGDYSADGALNIASFLHFIEVYLNKAKVAYVNERWLNENERPDWLEDCKEYESQEVAPVTAYEDLIKIFTLAGAAIETLAEINPEFWREENKD